MYFDAGVSVQNVESTFLQVYTLDIALTGLAMIFRMWL
jgi:hypothetical protein